jgi:hypothetical protein
MPEPAVSSLQHLAPRDGQRVVVEGIYTKRMSQKKMNDPKLYFFGFVDLELDGGRVQLSTLRRPEEEVEAFAGKRVRVEGTVVMDRGAGSEYARPDPTPTLLEPSTVTLAE